MRGWVAKLAECTLLAELAHTECSRAGVLYRVVEVKC